MPPVIRWYVRAALLHLLAAILIGVAYQADQWLHWADLSPYWIVIHVHLALVGGVLQMIMGVGLWMFPLLAPIERRLPFRPPLAWTTFALFNGGLVGRFGAEMAFRGTHSGGYGALTVATGLMQLAAVLVFVYHVWALRPSRRSQAAAEA